jgi:hypothetical protein
MSLTISRAQRDILYELVVNHLSAIGGELAETQAEAHTWNDPLRAHDRRVDVTVWLQP